MLQQRGYKICLVGDMLAGGGAERVHALLSQYFDANGIEVHNVIVQDKVEYPYSGRLLNLGQLKNKTNGPFNKIRRFSVLRRYIRDNNFDYIIDFRVRQKPLQDLLISRLLYTSPAIYTVHSSRLDWYMPRQRWLARFIYGNAYGVAAVSRQIAEAIATQYGFLNLTMIHNPVDLDSVSGQAAQEPPLAGAYVVAMGRLQNDIKQFDKLIIAYAQSGLPKMGIRLVLLGQGPDLEQLKRLAAESGVEDMVLFEGFCTNPYVYIRNAMFSVLCSRTEGFPMALAESLACGTPVIAFDSFSGAAEIVRHEHNGLLVPGQDFSAFAAAMDRLASDKDLCTYCRENAVASVFHLSLDTIGAQWLAYLGLNDVS